MYIGRQGVVLLFLYLTSQSYIAVFPMYFLSPLQACQPINIYIYNIYIYTNIISHKIYMPSAHTHTHRHILSHTHSPSQESTHMRTCIYICMYYVIDRFCIKWCQEANTHLGGFRMVQLVRVESAEDLNQNGTQYYRLLN